MKVDYKKPERNPFAGIPPEKLEADYKEYLELLRREDPELAEVASHFRPWIRYKNKKAVQQYVEVVRPYRFYKTGGFLIPARIVCDCITDREERAIFSFEPEQYTVRNVDPKDLEPFVSLLSS